VWWITRGSRQQRLDPGRPEQHGAHERRPRTRNADATRPPEPHPAAPQARFDRFGREYTEERPHAALTYRTPASRYRPSPRVRPAQLPPPTYPGPYVGRRVSKARPCRCQTRPRFSSDPLLQEAIALEETAEGLWSLDVDDVLLARLDARDFTRYV